MGRLAFENFGLAAEVGKDDTLIASRYSIQKNAEKNIVLDVIKKLDLKCDDDLLDIGCNTGNITIPLSFVVNKIFAIDHENCLKRFSSRLPLVENIVFTPGNFLDINLSEKVDKILVYSVLHYLESDQEILKFIQKALSNLKPGGSMLLGDIPNESKRERFEKTESGKLHVEKLCQKIEENKTKTATSSIGDYLKNAPKDSKYAKFDDHLIILIVDYARKQGFNCEILDQHPNMPFFYEREDILITSP